MRYALRTLRHAPGATVASILTLGLGIGTATAVFGVAYGVLARPLPFADPSALVQLTAKTAGGPQGFSLTEIDDWRARASIFKQVALFSTGPFALAETAEISPLSGAIVSGDFFSALGVPLRLGRALTPADDLTASAVVSERLWRQRLGGDAAVIGRSVRLNGESRTIVGVAPAQLRFPAADIDVWVPVGSVRRTAPPQWNMRGFRGFSMIARLNAGVAMGTVAAEASRIARDLEREFPRFNRDTGVTVTPLREQLTAPVKPALLLLLAAAVLVLIAACANVANLRLADALTRQREIAIRLAIGARRSDIARQILAEAGAIAAAGASVGLGLAVFGLRGLHRLDPFALPRLDDVRVDFPVLLFLAASAAIAALILSGASALQTSRMGALSALREGRAMPSVRTRRVQTALVMFQIAASVLLLIGGLLLVRTVSALLRVPLGVQSENVLTARVTLAGSAFVASARQTAFLTRLLETTAAMPGVNGAALASSLPPDGSQMRTGVTPPRRAPTDAADVITEIIAVSQDTFGVLGVRVLGGRPFTAADSAESPRVVVLSETAARRLFPGEDPLGRTLPLGASSAGTGIPTVVGIVSDVRYAGFDAAPYGAVYLPYGQRPFRATHLIVRTHATSASGDLQRSVAALDPGVAVSSVRPLDELVSDAAAVPRFRATFLIALSGLVLSLAAVGLYAVTAQAVSSRRVEFAVRLALGAAPRRVLTLVLWHGLRVTTAGAALGLVAAAGLTRLMSRFVFGVPAADPVSFAVAPLLMLGIGLASCAVPALRAARTAPAVSLRSGV